MSKNIRAGLVGLSVAIGAMGIGALVPEAARLRAEPSPSMSIDTTTLQAQPGDTYQVIAARLAPGVGAADIANYAHRLAIINGGTQSTSITATIPAGRAVHFYPTEVPVAGVPAVTTTLPPATTAPATTAPATTAPVTTVPVVPSGPSGSIVGCGLANAVFCATFDAPANGGTRTGDLDPTLWGVSRMVDSNPGQNRVDSIANVSITGCGTTAQVYAPSDVRICNGQLFEGMNDGGGVVNLDIYPKQPFNFAGRTGKVTFDVSADSEGSHAAWPEFVITDKPVPGVRAMISGQIPPSAANQVGFTLDGSQCGSGNLTGVGRVFITKNNVYSEPPVSIVNCITKGSSAKMNHIEVRVSQNRLEVWGTDAGSTALKQLAVSDNLGLTFSQGLVWMNDVHYNARKAIEPCECGTQYNHTFAWDNLGFDGPKTYRDLGFDIADSKTATSPSFHGDPSINLGYQIGTGPTTLTVPGVNRVQTPTGAQVVLNTYSFATTIPSISINGGPWIDTPWPYDAQTYSWRAISIPVPLDQIHDGTNTISFKSTDWSTQIANVSIILVAAAPVP